MYTYKSGKISLPPTKFWAAYGPVILCTDSIHNTTPGVLYIFVCTCIGFTIDLMTFFELNQYSFVNSVVIYTDLAFTF